MKKGRLAGAIRTGGSFDFRKRRGWRGVTFRSNWGLVFLALLGKLSTFAWQLTVVFVFLGSFQVSFAPHSYPEKYYQYKWCSNHHRQAEVAWNITVPRRVGPDSQSNEINWKLPVSA